MAPSGKIIVSSSGPATTWLRDENIPFTLGPYVRVSGYRRPDLGIIVKIIASRTELDAESPRTWEDPRYSKGVDRFTKYSDEYFKDRAIVLIEEDIKDIANIYAQWQVVTLPLFAKIPDSPYYP